MTWSEGEHEGIFSYPDFRKATGLSKKEADVWVRNGLIQARLSSNGRWRKYRMESVIEGLIAKKLADFASRELLKSMMDAVREHLDRNGLDPHWLLTIRTAVRIYTRPSKKVAPGGGVRGVVAMVERYSFMSVPDEKAAVFLVLDLTLIAHEAHKATQSLWQR